VLAFVSLNGLLFSFGAACPHPCTVSPTLAVVFCRLWVEGCRWSFPGLIITCWEIWVVPVVCNVSVPNRPVRPSSSEDGMDYGSESVFLGVLGRTTPGKVRTGRSIGDYSPSA